MIKDNNDKTYQQRREELLKSRLISKVCPNCKCTKNPSDALFCNECGSILNILPMNAPKGVEAIDLGLPSGTKWANMNVGATCPEDYGGLYAWGELEVKDYYSVDTYIHCEKSGSYHDLADSICGTPYDVAYMKWGGNWRMPSYEQILELTDNCTFKWMKQGALFISRINEHCVYFPAAGFRRYDYCHFNVGNYWSGTRNSNYPYGEWAHYLDFDRTGHHVRYGIYNSSIFRDQGLSVRPVFVSQSVLYMKRHGGDVFNEMPGGHLLKENSEQQDGE